MTSRFGGNVPKSMRLARILFALLLYSGVFAQPGTPDMWRKVAGFYTLEGSVSRVTIEETVVDIDTYEFIEVYSTTIYDFNDDGLPIAVQKAFFDGDTVTEETLDEISYDKAGYPRYKATTSLSTSDEGEEASTTSTSYSFADRRMTELLTFNDEAFLKTVYLVNASPRLITGIVSTHLADYVGTEQIKFDEFWETHTTQNELKISDTDSTVTYTEYSDAGLDVSRRSAFGDHSIRVLESNELGNTVIATKTIVNADGDLEEHGMFFEYEYR